MNFSDLLSECHRLADMLADEFDNPFNELWEAIDSHQWVIYTGSSWDVVNAAREAGGHLLDDADGEVIANQGPMHDIDRYMSSLAFWIMVDLTGDRLHEIEKRAIA